MKRKITRDITRIALFAAVMCVSAFVYIPLPVPITMQIFVMFASLFVLGGKCGSIVVFIYIAIGALGLPVFSGFSGGISRIFDATGGYIIGMLLASLLWWLLDSVLPKKPSFRIINSLTSLLLIYLFGTLWFTFLYTNGEKTIGTVLLSCVVPFLVPDVLKIYLAYYVSRKIPNRFLS